MRFNWWRWKMTPFKGLLLALFGISVVVAIVRLFTGLGAVTGLTDNSPWGLWKAFDVIVVIPLGASGFTMAFVRYFTPGGERYEHTMRRAVIWAAISYLSAGLRLGFDIGLPWRLPNPLIFGGNLHSPLFEVAWCMALYIMILFFENIPRVMERQKHAWVHKLEVLLHKIMPGFVLFGVLLSTMHQSSLGTLYMIVGKRMDPLWYHPWLNYLYLLTAIAAGLAITIMIDGWSNNYYKTPFSTNLLAKFAPFIGGALSITLVWRLYSLFVEGQMAQLFVPRVATVLWWGEIIIGYLIPIVIFFSGMKLNRKWLITAAIMTVGGMIAFRFNVVFTAMFDAFGAIYVPKLPEILFTIGATAGTMVIYTWFVETLPAILGQDAPKEHDLQHAGD